MNITALLLVELDREAGRSRRALENMPEGKQDWKPHDKSMPFGYLAELVATMPTWVEMEISRDELDLLDARSPPPRRGFEGVRVQRVGEIWDVGVWARNGVRPAPILTGDLDDAEERGQRRYIQLGRRFAHEVGFGLQVSRDVAGWRLRGEVSHQRSADPDLKNAALWTLEAQRSLRSGVLTMTAAGNALDAPEVSVLHFDRAFLPGFVIGADQKESWGSWRIAWLGTYKKIGSLLQLDLGRDLSSRVKLTVGADLPDGSRLESFGAFANAQRVRASLRYAW